MSETSEKTHDGSCLAAGILEKDNVILEKAETAPAIFYFQLKASMAAKQAQAGQFVVVRTDEQSERIPPTIGDFDREKGAVTIFAQVVGASTHYRAAGHNPASLDFLEKKMLNFRSDVFRAG